MMTNKIQSFYRGGLFIRYVGICLIVFGLFLLPLNSEAAAFKQVLLLQSYHHGHQWEEDVAASIEKVFRESDDNVRLIVEYMDTKRSKTSAHYRNLTSLYREKFKNDSFDLIIANDDNALFYALDKRKELFNNAPIVFCGLSHNPVERLSTEENVTGIIQNLEFKKTLQLAISLNPKIDKFIVINDQTSSGLKRTPQIKQALAELDHEIPYSFYDNLSIDELQQVLTAAHPNTALFIHLFNRDRTGKTFSNAELFDLIETSFRGHVYAVKKNYLEYGIIGGVLSDGELHGAKAASIALEIMNGKNASECPLIMDDIDLPSFSYPQLKKNGIDEAKLPEPRRVFNRPFSFYQTYKLEIYLVAAIILLLIAVISFLVFYIALRRRANKELLSLRNYLSNIIDSMPSILVGLNINGEITQWNSRAEQSSGVAVKDALGQQLKLIFPSIPVDMQLVSDAISTRQTIHSAKQVRQNSSENRFEDVTIYPLIANGVDGAVVRVDDVTERIQMDELLVQSEKMLSVGGLAAGMAHEINNPLSIIGQSSQNAVRRLNVDFPANQQVATECGIDLHRLADYLDKRGIYGFFDNIDIAVKRSAEIIKSMLNFSSTNASQREVCAIGDIIQESLTLANGDYSLKRKHAFRNIEIEVNVPENLPMISVNRIEIQQVIFNLLKNSGQAMSGIAIEGVKSKIILTVSGGKKSLTLKVTDNGPGIPAPIQARIFDPFYTTKEPGSGTGLGLSVSYFIIVKRHLGQFYVKSEEGKGASFFITLPYGGGSE